MVISCTHDDRVSVLKGWERGTEEQFAGRGRWRREMEKEEMAHPASVRTRFLGAAAIVGEATELILRASGSR
jgi:hypothetical protein